MLSPKRGDTRVPCGRCGRSRESERLDTRLSEEVRKERQEGRDPTSKVLQDVRSFELSTKKRPSGKRKDTRVPRKMYGVDTDDRKRINS